MALLQVQNPPSNLLQPGESEPFLPPHSSVWEGMSYPLTAGAIALALVLLASMLRGRWRTQRRHRRRHREA